MEVIYIITSDTTYKDACKYEVGTDCIEKIFHVWGADIPYCVIRYADGKEVTIYNIVEVGEIKEGK